MQKAAEGRLSISEYQQRNGRWRKKEELVNEPLIWNPSWVKVRKVYPKKEKQNLEYIGDCNPKAVEHLKSI